MKKYIPKNNQSGKFQIPPDKRVARFQQNAKRLEYVNVRNKNKGRKRSVRKSHD